MQLRSQLPKFKDLKICLWELFRKQAAISIICKPMFCHPHMQRKRCVRKSNMKQRRKTMREKHSPFPQSY